MEWGTNGPGSFEKSESSEFHAWPVSDDRGVIGVLSLQRLRQANADGDAAND
jgi:hypothetical protein